MMPCSIWPMIGRLEGGLERWVPGLRTLREYQRAWLASDLMAGLVLTALLVPVGMGYAQAAGLPPITGLYATIVPLAVLTGLVILVAGVARLGFVTELLSRPVQLGYLCGIAVTILVGQLPRLCGFSIEGRGLLTEIKDFAQGVADGQVNRASLAVGVTGIVVILVLRRLWRTVPGVMVAVLVGIAAVALFDLDQEGVQVLGVLPEGLPIFAFPAVELADLGALLSGALGIALVAVADTTVLSQSLAAQRDETVDPNQELRALGAANLAAGLFQGFAISSSASRTPVAVAAGARSQLTPLVGAVAIALLLVAAPGALRNLPLPMLAAIVITAALGLIDAPAVRRLYQVRRSEFVLWLAAFLGVALLGVLVGIFVAILLSLADFVRRVRELVADATPPVRWVVVAAEPITDVDTSAADSLQQLLGELRQANVTLAFAEVKGPVKDRLQRYGLFDAIGPDRFFPTIGTAVNGYIDATGTTWVDWEERPDPTAPGSSGADGSRIAAPDRPTPNP